MGIKMAVVFANIFMAKIEMQILNEGAHKPFVWKRYIDDIIFLLRQFIEEANKLYPIIKFKADIFVSAATLLDAAIYKGERFNRESVLNREPTSGTNSPQRVTDREAISQSPPREEGTATLKLPVFFRSHQV